jgi:antitoxin HicB
MPQHYRYTVILHPDLEEGGFSVEVSALPGWLTQGETYEDALAMAAEAIRCHIEGLRDDGEPIPEEDAPLVLTSVSVAA